MRIIWVLVLAFMATAVACADVTLGLRNDNPGSQSFDVYATKKINEQWGIFGYAAKCDDWSEVYVGPTYSPNANFQVGLGPGFEKDQVSRFGGFVWAGKGKVSATYLFEGSGSGPWHKFRLDFKASPRVSVGLTNKSPHGWGLTTAYTLSPGLVTRVTAYENRLISTELGVSF